MRFPLQLCRATGVSLAFFAGLPLAAGAQSAPAVKGPGAVAQFVAAQDLFALGRTQKDPLATLAAARLAARISATDADRTPEPAAETLPPGHPDAATMFLAAKALAAEDETLTDLIARSEAESTRLPTRTLQRTTRAITAAGSQSYDLPFFAASLAEVGLLGDGTVNLDLSVTDTDGKPICLEQGPTDRAVCSFVLPENATVKVTITNRSDNAASYSLLTN